MLCSPGWPRTPGYPLADKQVEAYVAQICRKLGVVVEHPSKKLTQGLSSRPCRHCVLADWMSSE